jgi:hypothetical protein
MWDRTLNAEEEVASKQSRFVQGRDIHNLDLIVVIVSNVLAKEGWKEGVRNCIPHLGELVSHIRDDSLDKLLFMLQRSLQARIGGLRVVLGHRG